MFWLSFVYPRSHSSWIGPIGQFNVSSFRPKPAYRYSIPLSPDLHSIWRDRLVFHMLFRTSRIGWLVFCIIWLSFVYSRSHSGWIGPIGEFKGAESKGQQNYRYSIPLSPDLPSILGHRLTFLSQIVPVRWRDLVFVCFDWVLYTQGPIPAELGQLANLEQLDLDNNKLTGTPSLFPLTCIRY